MVSSDDVRRMTDESSAGIHRGRRAVRRRLIRTNLQPELQGNPSIASGGANLRILFTRFFKRNDRSRQMCAKLLNDKLLGEMSFIQHTADSEMGNCSAKPSLLRKNIIKNRRGHSADSLSRLVSGIPEAEGSASSTLLSATTPALTTGRTTVHIDQLLDRPNKGTSSLEMRGSQNEDNLWLREAEAEALAYREENSCLRNRINGLIQLLNQSECQVSSVVYAHLYVFSQTNAY
ncbi:unnamed protein product [Protopolystoma xenopodis]|uniref:Uncharacterized protein n=1 Tax=Protopolystoma xenopodis TaxID=117903 RepID=A0A3S5AMT2_9PLAT|nr:unnamed protein product [Protopolystoma xenopodis]